MNDQKIDLNLLTVFEQVMRERSITRAAAALGLTQPAVSNAIARLRALTGDPMFVRSARGVVPTARAQAMAQPLAEALARIRATLVAAAFEPALAERTFTLVASDLGEAYFLPRLVAHLADVAPGLRLRTLPSPRAETREALASGAIDLAVGYLPGMGPGLYQQRLFRERYVAIVRRGHPTIRDRLSSRQFERCGHVLAAPSGTGHAAIERVLARHGGRERIVVEVQHFLAVPAIVAQTDLVGIAPTRIAREALRDAAVKLVELPFAIPPFVVAQYWHARAHLDPGHRWLRAVFVELFSDREARRT